MKGMDGVLQSTDEPNNMQILDPFIAFVNTVFLLSCYLSSVFLNKLCQQLYYTVEKATCTAVTWHTDSEALPYLSQPGTTVNGNVVGE